MRLAKPILPMQIRAASKLHSRLMQWRTTDNVLEQIKRNMPGFGAEECLLKATVVNALYSTNVYAIFRMALHVDAMLVKHGVEGNEVDLVSSIAELPDGKGGSERNFVSFAAKFCHFFIDGERFPIYDEAARRVLRYHIGRASYDERTRNPYKEFYRAFGVLRDSIGSTVKGREIDRYLWITGLYMKWLGSRDRANAQVNIELRQVFLSPAKEDRSDLDAMLPPDLPRAYGPNT